MDLSFGKEEIAFQQEVRDWLKENLTPEIMGEIKAGRNAYMPKERLIDWQKRLAKKGWLCTGWPKEFGGPGFTTTQKYIFEMEMARAHAPGTSPFGPKMCAPVIMKYGSAEQKARHLPPMLNSDLIWCQGYSEPGSGSDLASLCTKAERQGDFYIVNGQKTWTTLAQTADWIFCLVRTSNEGKRQEGISFLLIDMKTPGISVEPIITSDGNRAGTQEVNSVFFTDVKVPVSNRVGEENMGWTYAKYLLEFERGGNPYSPRLRSGFERLKTLAQAQPEGEDSIMADAAWREKLARMDIEISGLEMFEQEFYSKLASGQNPGPLSSMIKLRGTEVMQQVQEFAVEAVGWYSMPFPEQRTWNSNVEPIGPEGADVLAPRYFNGRKMTIYGGSSEVQRGIMSKVMLGAHDVNGSRLRRQGTRLPAGGARLDLGQHAAGGGRGEPPQPYQPRLQGAAAAVAEEARGEGLALPELAGAVRRAGLELDAEVHFRDGDGARQFALSLLVQHQDGGAGSDEVRQRRAEEALPAENRRGRGTVVPGLF